ncbi:uncharacterized protein Pyn_06186 [Prunus yedoensis var. nudiflora]|uniref:Uncharacterized protein n=1 Tax=Prunus yedoensis var. nudiflora TaxID=2094558 RepID=A0A314UJW6_PRUYE|nr:uncharacterized protein Pyn_06186 [Prunus yedoensis var. nudiflora]
MTWNISHIEPFIPSCEAAKIRAIPIGTPFTSDRLVWPEVKSGNYSVKIGYYHIKGSPPISRNRASTSHLVNKEVWRARCKALFNDLRPSLQLVLTQAISCLEEFSRAKDLATVAPLINSGAPTRSYWSSPPLPFVKINIDGA